VFCSDAPGRGPSSEFWVFTLNNPTAADEAHLQALTTVGDGVAYLVYGREIAPGTGTPHLQGFICFTSRQRRGQLLATGRYSGVCKALGTHRAHTELKVKNSTFAQVSEYSKKDGDFYEYGTLPVDQRTVGVKSKRPGKCEEFVAAVRDGERDQRVLLERFPGVFRSREFVQFVLAMYAPLPVLPAIVLYPWQHHAVSVMNAPPSARKIHFYVDLLGNGGKTTFARWLVATYGSGVQILRPSTLENMAHVLSVDAHTVVMDVPRECTDRIQYSFLEGMKDGLVFAPKYQSCMKTFATALRVLVFLNAAPLFTALSADRYDCHVVPPDPSSPLDAAADLLLSRSAYPVHFVVAQGPVTPTNGVVHQVL